MRGIGADKGIIGLLHGITPAYAGNRVNDTANAAHNENYPRVCGE